ncbi:septin-4 isoform X7 [Talpa occidentalis]|uniref:septin-4 isoform X7 n=1 Tax=Talpa occidentalis TaxID=50954 RepID=UPI00188F40A2|nr:septin-4 isoform X7 [Talpa occidentalis]
MKSLCCRQTGGWCCAHQGRQRAASWGSQSEEEGTAEKPVILLQLSCPWRVGAKGRGGGRVQGRTFHRLFWPLTETWVREKGKRAIQEAGLQQEHQDHTVSVCEELWEIKLDLGLADRESEAWDMDHPLRLQGSSVPEDRTEAGIKHFLEDTDDAELNKFVKDFPGSESCHQPEAKTWGSRPQILEPRPQAPDLCQDDLEFRPPSWPQSSDNQQSSAPAPLSPSARPRSPWGKLDPYDSSEDDKEYVGFATLPNQVHRKSVKKGFDFTLMVAGESGLGKSTLVNSLFLTDLYRDRKLLSAEERITQTVEITKHAVDIEEKGVRLRLTIVDTPGFGDAVNNTECWKPVAEYIDQQFEQYFRDESGLNRKNIQDNRVHCCLYFISPFGHGLRPLDVEFMKALHQRVNIVPILAKADTLTPPEVERKKRKIREEIELFGIKVYQFPDCDSDEDEDFKLQDQALKESIPFAVIGSNTVVEARGRRVRGRLYPWGIVEVENPGHCDFVKLRTMLVRTHMQDLKDVTRETHYENYRAQCIQSMTRLVVKERNRNKLTRESGTDFPIPAVPPGTDPETERLIREKDEELRRMQEMLHKIQRQMKETH